MHKHTCIHTVAGVLYVHIHSAADLVSADSDGFSDPYCIVLANKKKVKEIFFRKQTLILNYMYSIGVDHTVHSGLVESQLGKGGGVFCH